MTYRVSNKIKIKGDKMIIKGDSRLFDRILDLFREESYRVRCLHILERVENLDDIELYSI